MRSERHDGSGITASCALSTNSMIPYKAMLYVIEALHPDVREGCDDGIPSYCRGTSIFKGVFDASKLKYVLRNSS